VVDHDVGEREVELLDLCSKVVEEGNIVSSAFFVGCERLREEGV
jgi:hypothetical protein